MNKPNLFIVGAAKSGTTTLYHYLEKHSEVFMPEDELYKEPAFFTFLVKGVKFEDYLNIFKNATDKHKYIGEASTAYLTDTKSAKTIYEFDKNAKIIIILRNPADRAYSLYNWMVQEGYEYSSYFQSALDKEVMRQNKKIPNFFEPEYHWNYMYFTSGLYYEQVKRYFDLFDHKNIKVVIFEEMIANIQNIYKEISDFLNIGYEEINVIRENESKAVHSPLISFIGRKLNNNVNIIRNRISKINTKMERDQIIYFLQKNDKPDKIDKVIKKNLLDRYCEDIGKLESLLNKNLSIWKK